MQAARRVRACDNASFHGIARVRRDPRYEPESQQGTERRRVAYSILDVLSNESRLSCGAKLKYSQMEFYHTARRTFAGLIEEGRRQLQAHVRPQRSSAAACRMAHSSPDTARPTST